MVIYVNIHLIMIRNKTFISCILIIFAMLCFSCKNNYSPTSSDNTLTNQIYDYERQINECKDMIKSLESKNKETLLLNISNNVLNALKNKDMDTILSYVHPDLGIRFTMSTYVDTEKDIVLKPDELKDALNSTKIYTWGISDGKGDEVKLTFKDYYERYIYDKDFINADIIGNNTFIGTGNTLNNAKEIYPTSSIIEYHFKGFDPQYAGIDWESLRLVFNKENDNWYLIGIIHAEWTI